MKLQPQWVVTAGKQTNKQNKELIEVRDYLLSFGAEYFVFQFSIHKFKDHVIQNYSFAFVLYGCETWSLTMREERRLKVSENKVLRRIVGPKRDEVTREWRKLHNEELNDLYCSHNIV